MQEINKAFIYRMLNEIHSTGVDVTNYRAMLVGANDIPYELITFINKHRPIEKLRTYNEIYSKRRNSPLFRNLMKMNLPVDEKAIILSSLLTQSLIGAKHAEDDEQRDSMIDAINIEMIITSLMSYINEHDSSLVSDTFDTFQHIFRTLFPRK